MSLEQTIRQFCKDHHLRLNTDLGQHFLIDEEVLDNIIEAAQLSKSDTAVEIGPGVGVLTKLLVGHAGEVQAIEIDKRMIPLIKKYAGQSVEIANNNALKVPLPSKPYKIVANIPYHITSPLLRHAFLESEVQPTSLTLLIQKEVAEKICSVKDAGLLTILVALFGTPRIVCNVPPGSFLPPPKVDSAVLHIDCFAQPIADPQTIEAVFKLTKLAFSQKRKMLSNTLGSSPEGKALLEKAGIDTTRRPQTLSIEEWIALAKAKVL